MASVPPIIDIRDDLNRALEATDDDAAVAEDIDGVLDRLDEFADRDQASADREGFIDVADNELLRIEELVDDDDEEAARAIQSARNRLHIYRESREESDESLAVIDSGVRQDVESEGREGPGGRGEPERGGVLPVGEVTLTVTVANSGDDAEVVPTVTFYDERGEELESVRGPAFDLEAGTEGQIELDVEAPSDATHYAVSVADESA